MKPTLRRSTLALATVVACLAMLASPASASSSHDGDIIGGTVDVANPAESIPLGGTGGACAPGTVKIGHDTSVSPHGVDITALSTTGEFQLPKPTGSWWVAQISRVSSIPGTHTASAINNVGLTATAVIRGPITPGTCDITAPIRCTITAALTFNGTWTDNAPVTGDIDVGDTAKVSASPVAVTKTPPCLPPFTNLVTAGVTDLELELTT